MAVTDVSGLTISQIADDVPININVVGTPTAANPVSLGMMTQWKNEAEGRVASALASRDVSTTLGDDAKVLVQRYVKDFVITQVLMKLGAWDLAEEYREEYRDALKSIKEMPEELGDSKPSDSRIKSNIDKDNPTSTIFGGGDFTGW